MREKGIPLNIRNTNAPAHPGTLIMESFDDEPSDDRFITGIAGKTGFVVITVEKDMMNAELGFGRRVLEVLEKRKNKG